MRSPRKKKEKKKKKKKTERYFCLSLKSDWGAVPPPGGKDT